MRGGSQIQEATQGVSPRVWHAQTRLLPRREGARGGGGGGRGWLPGTGFSGVMECSGTRVMVAQHCEYAQCPRSCSLKPATACCVNRTSVMMTTTTAEGQEDQSGAALAPAPRRPLSCPHPLLAHSPRAPRVPASSTQNNLSSPVRPHQSLRPPRPTPRRPLPPPGRDLQAVLALEAQRPTFTHRRGNTRRLRGKARSH